jgi:hypothetical protein
MKEILTLILILCFNGIAFAQYVSQVTVQNQILKDQAIINSCNDSINAALADINAIENDSTAIEVTSNTPSIATEVQAIQASGVSTAQTVKP